MNLLFLVILWSAFLVLSLYIGPKYAPELMQWYPVYSLIVSILGSVFILAL